MQDIVKVDDINDIKKKISINISADNVDKKFTEFFAGIKNDVQIPGFRKGKAPISRIKQHFGPKARPTIAQMIISEFYEKAVRDNDINPVGNPDIHNYSPDKDDYPGEFAFDNAYSVSMTVEILPTIDPVGYDSLELDFPGTDINVEVENKMMEYRKKFSEHNQISDRAAQTGDSLIVDFSGTLSGDSEPFDGGTAEGFNISELGDGSMIPGFEDSMVGMSIGEEKSISVKFPDDYNADTLAGKDAIFEVKLHSIVEKKLAEVDDDLAMMVGLDSVDDLNSHVMEESERNIEMIERNSLESQITTKLLDLNTFEVPESMVKFEAQRLLKSAQGRGQNLPDNMAEMLEPSAKISVMKAMIIDAIYTKESDLEVTPDELDELLEEHAGRGNTTKDELVSMLYRTKQMDSFVGVLKSRKVVDYIINLSRKDGE